MISSIEFFIIILTNIIIWNYYGFYNSITLYSILNVHIQLLIYITNIIKLIEFFYQIIFLNWNTYTLCNLDAFLRNHNYLNYQFYLWIAIKNKLINV